jgi:hypothetical protein
MAKITREVLTAFENPSFGNERTAQAKTGPDQNQILILGQNAKAIFCKGDTTRDISNHQITLK